MTIDHRSRWRRALGELLGVPGARAARAVRAVTHLEDERETYRLQASALNARLERALLDLKGAEMLLEEPYEANPCCVTVSGFCQAHGFHDASNGGCPNERVRRFLVRQGIISE